MELQRYIREIGVHERSQRSLPPIFVPRLDSDRKPVVFFPFFLLFFIFVLSLKRTKYRVLPKHGSIDPKHVERRHETYYDRLRGKRKWCTCSVNLCLIPRMYKYTAPSRTVGHGMGKMKSHGVPIVQRVIAMAASLARFRPEERHVSFVFVGNRLKTIDSSAWPISRMFGLQVRANVV